jgi:hypothetical protein
MVYAITAVEEEVQHVKLLREWLLVPSRNYCSLKTVFK